MRSLASAAAPVLLVGVLFAGVEVGWVFATSHELFLSAPERKAYLAAALAVVVSVGLLFAVFGLVARRAGARAPALASLAAGAVGLPLAIALTAGRRVAGSSLRPVAVAALAAGVAAGAFYVARRLRHRLDTDGPSWGYAAAAFGLALASFVADATVLPRLYPALHFGLALLAVVSLALSASLAPPLGDRVGAVVAAVGLLLAPLAFVGVPWVLSQPNACFVVATRAPLTGKLIGALRDYAASSVPPPPASAVGPEATARAGRGVDLSGHDVLLVTVDALRADRVGPWGGEGLTPHMDALADEGVSFLRAYTPTPHTSYALTSLLTGKFLRPVLELPRAPTEHPALPELLRRYGYRTAAFYPPAIFFVDAHRFAALRESGFGFEYKKEMFHPASGRPEQLETYLEEVGDEHPVFAWVHLFEPHEPYDPPPEFATEGGAEARYDGEVRAADAALGALVEVFRRHHPEGTVIVTADHGEEFGDHDGYYHGTTLYDEQVRVPLIWSSPGVTSAATSESPVEIVDIATTLLAAVGIPRDARMRGHDLGAVLAGDSEAGPAYAYAGIGDARMVTDGRYKAICEVGACRLYDLVDDPEERRNLAGSAEGSEAAERLLVLRGTLSRFVGSIPRIEAMAMEGDVGWPEPLARAELGDPTVGPEVVPLLGDERAEVRAAAARATLTVGHEAALPVLARLAEHDPVPLVRIEAAVAQLGLVEPGAPSNLEGVAQWLAGNPASEAADLDLARRAALALASRSDARGAAVLRALAADDDAGEAQRASAVRALGQLRDRAALPVLVALLSDVRLRARAADALGQVGDAEAGPALAEQLRVERYLEARTAEARALVRLEHRQAAPLLRRFLGMETPLPGGVGLLVEAGALLPLAELRRGRDGEWQCDDEGCAPGQGAALSLRGPRHDARLVLRARADRDGRALMIGGRELAFGEGLSEVSCALPDGPGPWAVVGPGVRVVAAVVVASEEEIPPPAPEPFEEAASSDAGLSPPRGPGAAPD